MGDWERVSEKGRVVRYAESFRRLSEVFQYLPSKKETLSEDDLEEIFETARSNVCRACGRYSECWGKNDEKTARLVYDLLTVVAGEESQMEDSLFCLHIRERFCHYCIRAKSFTEELKNCFYRARLNMMWSNRMLENRAAVAEQLRETARIIQEIACTVFDAGEADSSLERKIKARFKLRHINVRDVRILEDGWSHSELILTANTGKGFCIPVRTIGELLSQVCGRSFVPERNSRLTLGTETVTLHFVEETIYYMLTGTARQACAGQTACGDNFAVLTGGHGQVILGISDGMGSGIRASRESQTVIELLEDFLNAGFTAETAVKMINSTMVLQRGMCQFSTLDICGINLYSGQCEFLKIGAATTFIRRAGWVETVTSASLPVGIFREVDFERSKRRLEHGDMIVMVSDGVLDALPEDESEELMKYLILQNPAQNPAEFAQTLLEQVLAFENNAPKDDMTVLAGGFFKK
ncbi:MAG: SpoIIE family protein phosphatase [Eubacteriales bacterium]|nr:SpoIIE family protein phosphatase [Eubacteriales bacterium]